MHQTGKWRCLHVVGPRFPRVEQRVSNDLDDVENVWIADKGQCDIVVCVTEKAYVLELPIKKKLICAMPERGELGTKYEAERTMLGVRRGHTIKVHAITKQLVASPYFRSYLKDSWNKLGESSLIKQLPLETWLASPQAYKRCIELLCSSEPCSAHVFTSSAEAADIYLASDHLLLREVRAVCMDYLASAPWSNEERQLLFEMFSTLGMQPSKDLAARLGLNVKETVGKSLSIMLWSYFQDVLSKGRDEDFSSIRRLPVARGKFILDVFPDVLGNLVHQGHATHTGPITTSRKIINELVDRGLDYCFEEMKSSREKTHWSKIDTWCLTNPHFLGWLTMMQLSADHATNGKKTVKSLAACGEGFLDLLRPSLLFNYPHEEDFTDPDESYSQSEQASLLSTEISLRRGRVGEKVVKLVAECFKRVAEAEIVVPESTRNSLIRCWVPWLEALHRDGKLREVIDWHTLRDHVSKILQTLRMDDEDVLTTIVEGAMSGKYLTGVSALTAWCGRLN